MKNLKLQTLLTTAALMTFAGSGWASTFVQQNPPATGQAGGSPEEIAARRRAYEERLEAERKQQQQPPESAKQGPQGTERALYEQEQAHRLRLGRIARLRALLRERGDTEKLAKLDEIAAKENLRYQRFTDIQKRKLSKLEAERAERGLARGRQRGTADRGTPREASAQREQQAERERAEQERQRREAKRAKQAQKPKSTNSGTGDIH